MTLEDRVARLERQLRVSQLATVLALVCALAAGVAVGRLSTRPAPDQLEFSSGDALTVVSAHGIAVSASGNRAMLAAEGHGAFLTLESEAGTIRADAGGDRELTLSLTVPDGKRALTATVPAQGSPNLALDDRGDTTELDATSGSP